MHNINVYLLQLEICLNMDILFKRMYDLSKYYTYVGLNRCNMKRGKSNFILLLNKSQMERDKCINHYIQ